MVNITDNDEPNTGCETHGVNLTDEKHDAAIRLLLDKGMAVEAAKLYPMDKAKEDADKDKTNALAAFAVASYYYYGVGERQVIHSAMDYALMAVERGYPNAKETMKKWQRNEKRKNMIYMIYFFEMCLSIPLFIVLAAYLFNNFIVLDENLQTVAEVMYVVPAIVGIITIRSFLKRSNLGRMHLHWWHYLMLLFVIPLMLLILAVPYVALLYGVMSTVNG